MSSEFIRKQIYDYLVSDGCNQSVARSAADKGVEFFNQGNHKDPYFDSLCYAGKIYAETADPKYKFKPPKKVTGKTFSYSKPKTRKHQKNQNAMFD